MSDNVVYQMTHLPIATKVERISIGIKDLDLSYGGGLPLGFLSIWSGESGVGKTRLCLDIMARLTRTSHKTLYIENEVRSCDFLQWASCFAIKRENGYVADFKEVNKHIAAIRKVKPAVCIIDSLNMIPHNMSQTALSDAMTAWKTAAEENHCHVIVLGQQNKVGEIKGPTSLVHLSDIACNLDCLRNQKNFEKNTAIAVKNGWVKKEDVDAMRYSTFFIEFVKNRTFRTGHKVYFEHTSSGVKFVDSDLVGFGIKKPTLKELILSQQEKENNAPQNQVFVKEQKKAQDFRSFVKNWAGI